MKGLGKDLRKRRNTSNPSVRWVTAGPVYSPSIPHLVFPSVNSINQGVGWASDGKWTGGPAQNLKGSS